MEKSKKQKPFGERVIDFYQHLSSPEKYFPAGVESLNPYAVPEVREYIKVFYRKFFFNNKERTFIFGINPGRSGGGTTGVQFTDPIALQEDCGIDNELPKKRELSSHFVYEAIRQWGGAEKFYMSFFLTAVFPMGLTRNGKNYNYYDDPSALPRVIPFIVESISRQIQFGANRRSVIVLGAGKNQSIFRNINNQYRFFKKIYVMEHPRYIMQYKRKDLKKYLGKYKKVLSEASP